MPLQEKEQMDEQKINDRLAQRREASAAKEFMPYCEGLEMEGFAAPHPTGSNVSSCGGTLMKKYVEKFKLRRKFTLEHLKAYVVGDEGGKLDVWSNQIPALHICSVCSIHTYMYLCMFLKAPEVYFHFHTR